MIGLQPPAHAGPFPAAVGTGPFRSSFFPAPVAATDVLLFGTADHLQDLFLPLHREQRLRSVTVVLPAEEAFGEGNLAVWKSYIAGIAPGADNAFLLADGGIAGEVEGLGVRIVPVRDWKGFADNGIVVLDLSFLLAMYRDEVRTPFVELPQKFLATIVARKIPPSMVRLWIADRDELPLEQGYLPKLLADLLKNPAAFRDALPKKWREVRDAEYLGFFSDFERASARLHAFLADEPEDPSALFRLAQMDFIDGNVERGMRYLKRSFQADPYYIRGFLESARWFSQAGGTDRAERILRAGLHYDPAAGELKRALGIVLLEQGRKLLGGNLPEAEARWNEIANLGLSEADLQSLREAWSEAKNAPSPPASPMGGMPPGHPAPR